MKALTEYTDRELLKKFAETFREYDSLKDSELETLESNGDRAFWTEEMDSDYQELVGDIIAKSKELDEMVRHVENLK